MALLSRSSLRGSVRRTPDDHSDNDGQVPPTRKLRVQENGSHRRRSSPDCLDTSAPEYHAGPGRARSAIPPLKPARPRTSTRRTRRSSSASIDAVASPTQSATPGNLRINGSSVVKNLRGPPRPTTPSDAGSANHVRDRHESPDPLDTISPALNRSNPQTQSGVAPAAIETEQEPTTPPVPDRTTRRNDPERKTDAVSTTKEENKTSEQVANVHVDDATQSQQKHQSDLAVPEQPASAPAGTERRSLRSADMGSRCKSELAQYFHNYEQLISLEAPKPELLAAATTVVLVDDLSEPMLPPSSPDPAPFGNPLQELHNCEAIELPEPVLRSAAVDPLGDEIYFRAHRKFERQEKQLRNIERDRAQHEKQTVDRLLEELRGQDWLRVMGINSVHESDKKLYEPKRQILIQELVALVNKFQVWKDEERRRKLAKDKPLPATDTEAEPRRPRKRSRPAEGAGDRGGSPASELNTPSTPDPNDVDAQAARQLHQEARCASAAKPRKSLSSTRKGRPDPGNAAPSNENLSASKRPKIQQTIPAFFYEEPPPDKPFTSFFEDPQARDAALAAFVGSWDARGSTILALGRPIPDVEQREFEPPPDLLTEEFIQSSRRQRRRLKRQSRG